MPRPCVDPDGRIVPESELRTLYVVWFSSPENWVFSGYLTKRGTFGSDRRDAAAWPEKEQAETCAAWLVVGNPEKFLGRISVKEIRG